MQSEWLMGAISRLCLLTHRDASVTAADVPGVLEVARALGFGVVAPAVEADKHPELASLVQDPASSWQQVARSADAVLVLAGDGTLLRVLAALPDGPPALGVNYGILGYLAGIGHGRVRHALESLAAGEFSVVELPSLVCSIDPGDGTGPTELPHALNDVVASGGVTGRIIELAWSIVTPGGGAHDDITDAMGIVPCDGMVLATPVGSTAYNLSNGGPIVAWGVGGYAVSFIAPHTLAARPLIVAPEHEVEITHMGRGVDLQVFADGAPVGELGPGARLRVRTDRSRPSRLAVVDDKTFYARYRDSFATSAGDVDVRRPRSLPAPPLPHRPEGNA